MIACAVELVTGGFGGVCLTAAATWYLLDRRHKRQSTKPDVPTSTPESPTP